jgi:hypothetical protein
LALVHELEDEENFRAENECRELIDRDLAMQQTVTATTTTDAQEVDEGASRGVPVHAVVAAGC